MYKSKKEMYKSVVSKRKRIHQLFQRKRTMPARVQTSLLPLESGRPSRAEACRSDLSTAIAAGARQRPPEPSPGNSSEDRETRDQNALPRDLAVTVSPPARQALASLTVPPGSLAGRPAIETDDARAPACPRPPHHTRRGPSPVGSSPWPRPRES